MTPAGLEDHGTPREGAAWRVVGGLLLVLTASSGLGFYNQSLYLSALSTPGAVLAGGSLGLSLATVSGAVSVFFVASSLAGLVIARLLQLVDVRLVMVVGAVVGGLVLASFGGIDSAARLYATYALFGAAYACVSLIPATTLVTAWFAERRGFALSVASTGLSLGGVLLTPLSTWLLAVLPFADAMRILGVGFVLVIVPSVLVFVRAPPQRPVAGAVAHGIAYAVAVRSRYFGVLAAAFMILMFAQVGAIAHQFTLVLTRTDAVVAASAVSVLAAASVIGRLLGGWYVERIGLWRFTVANVVGQGAGLALLAVTSNAPSLLVSSALFGVTVGNLLMLQPLLLSTRFAGADFGRVFALAQGLSTLGVAAGPLLVGVLQIELGYISAYLMLAVASFLALLLLAVAANMRPAVAAA